MCIRDSYRISGGFRGDLNETWSYEAGITYSRDDFFDSTRSDVLADALQGAINDGTFNPFGTALTGESPNDPAVIASLRANNEREVDLSFSLWMVLFLVNLVSYRAARSVLWLGAI